MSNTMEALRNCDQLHQELKDVLSCVRALTKGKPDTLDTIWQTNLDLAVISVGILAAYLAIRWALRHMAKRALIHRRLRASRYH